MDDNYGALFHTPSNGQGSTPERTSGRQPSQEWVGQTREQTRQTGWVQAHQASTRPHHLPADKQHISDKSTLKVYLPNGGFNVVKFGDATDIKVIIVTFYVKAAYSKFTSPCHSNADPLKYTQNIISSLSKVVCMYNTT